MAWNLKNIENALRNRLQLRSTLVLLVGDSTHIKPDGTGGELYPAVNFRVSEYPNLSNQHKIKLYIYIDAEKDTDGDVNHNNCLDIAAEVEAELFYKPQTENPGTLLDLSSYNYRCFRQEKLFDSGPVIRENVTDKIRQTQHYLFIIDDFS